nr:Cyclin-dependent protein kinase [Naematelia aurantialba]
MIGVASKTFERADDLQDLKPNNLLIAADGQLKVADFGLAREFAEAGERMTVQVITRWYRPPELFWGARHYTTAVDIWSMGMIFIELILRVPYTAGESDIDQLRKTFHAFGSPSEEDWPGHKLLPDYHDMSGYPPRDWASDIKTIGKEGQTLAQAILQHDPARRISARKALHHRFFSCEPRPTQPVDLPKPLKPLRPRKIAPEETEGKPVLSSDGPKRKAESPSRASIPSKIARRLF